MRGDLIRALAAKGYSAEQIADLADLFADHAQAEADARRATGAERTRAWRARKRDAERVTVTGDVTVTSQPLPPPPSPPSPITPSPLPPATIPESPRRRAVAVCGAAWPDGWFNTFWNAYPRKVGKLEALRSLERLQSKGVAFEAIMAGVSRIKTDGDLKFVPHAATWLNQRRFEDEDASGPTDDLPPKDPKHGKIIEASDAIIAGLAALDAPITHDRAAPRLEGQSDLCGGTGSPAVRAIPQGRRERPGDLHDGDYGSF